METGILPYGIIGTPEEIGKIVQAKRKESGMVQKDAAGLLGIGVRFLSELERGKPTLELGKTLQVLQRMGLEVRIMPRGGRPQDVNGG